MRSIYLGVAIAASVLLPQQVLGNPLEGMEGQVYQTKSEPGVGVKNYGLPAELVDRGGWVLGDVSVEHPYIISIFQYDSATLISFEQILFQQSMRRSEGFANHQYRLILDTVAVADPSADQLFGCEIDQQPDPEIVAIATAELDIDSEWITEITSAWRANRETQQFEPLPTTENIRCPNMGYGI